MGDSDRHCTPFDPQTSMLELSARDARRLAVISQALHTTKPFGTGKQAVQRCIEHLGYVQIDTISVINRSHHHTFWTRVPSYTEGDLDALQKERKIFEYWAHAAAYLPMRDYRFCLPYMHAVASGQKHWRKPDRKAMRAVLDKVRTDGPLRAKDIVDPQTRDKHWGWNWKPAKIALEQLFIEGKLVASHRQGFQKVYDLPERVLPADLDTTIPTAAEFQRYLIKSALRAHGLVAEPEVSYLRKGAKSGVRAQLEAMAESGEILRAHVNGQRQLYYTSAEAMKNLTTTRVTRTVHLLSPFDNAVIQRKRLQQLFGSDYQIECFVPPAKRKFGYYCLPILYGTDIVGRLDPKADRRSGQFIVKAVYLEKSVRDEAPLVSKLAAKLRELAAFNGCTRIVVEPGRGEALAKGLAAELARSV